MRPEVRQNDSFSTILLLLTIFHKFHQITAASTYRIVLHSETSSTSPRTTVYDPAANRQQRQTENMDELYRSREETKPSTKQRKPYYIHTSSTRGSVKPPRTSKSSTRQNPTRNNSTSTSSGSLINPQHPPEICPPRASRWQKLKEENEQRKNREVMSVSPDQAASITGRDQRGFRIHEDGEGWWFNEQKKCDRPTTGCAVM